MRFSIITATYNDLAGLRATYASITQQDFRDFEWIIIDGGSTDGSKQFLASLSGDVTWVSEPDSGIYDAMNKGIEKSHGAYLLFLNAGDQLSSSHVLRLVDEALRQHDEPDLLLGGADFVFAERKSVYRSPKRMDRYIWHGLPANHQATYYKRAGLGDLLYDTTYRICGDYYIIAKLYLRGVRAAYIDRPLVRFAVGGASYLNPLPLFLEPYRIQRDILGEGFIVRLTSLGKRLFSTVAMAVLKMVY